MHYTPAPAAIEVAAQLDNAFTPPVAPLLLVEGDAKTDRLVTYPLNTTASSPGFLHPKYRRLRTVTFEGFGEVDEEIDGLLTLPAGFVRDPYFGLGVIRDLNYLIHAIEKINGVTDLRIQSGRSDLLMSELTSEILQGAGVPTVSGDSYVITAKQFDDARKAINRAHKKALAIAADESAFTPTTRC